jgi:hypothetical protein
MATREQVMEALLKLLSGSGSFKTTGRRLRNPETIPTEQTPALILIKEKELYVRASASLPPKRILHVSAVVYFDVGNDQTAIPDSVINPLLDGFDTSMVPDNWGKGTCTLGGLVESARIDGEVELAPGDKTGKGLAFVPIMIVMP